VALDEHVEVDRIEVVTRGVRQAGDISRRNHGGRPFDIPMARLDIAGLSVPARDVPKSSETLLWQRLQKSVSDAQEAAPRDVVG